MGWFDDEVVYSAGIGITHLVKKLPENPIKAAVLSAIRNDQSIVNNIIAAREKTLFARVEDLLDYVEDSPYFSSAQDYAVPASLGKRLPIFTIRQNDSNTINSTDAVRVKIYKKALTKIGLDLKNITDGVNASPSTVDDVYVMFAFNVMSNKESSKEYLFYFLEALYDPVHYAQWWQGYQFNGGINAYVWKASDSPLDWGRVYFTFQHSAEFVFNVAYSTIRKEILTGVIGSIGTLTKTTHLFTQSSDDELFMIDDNDHGVDTNFDRIVVSKQVSATQYVRYTVWGLEVRNQVKTPDATITFIHSVGQTQDVVQGFPNRFAHGSKQSFILPVTTAILEKADPFTHEEFLADSLIIYVNSVDSTSIAWYESTGFLNFIGDLISVVSIVFGGTVAGSLSNDLISLLKQVAISVLTSIVSVYLFEILAPLIGEVAAATILGVALIAAAGYVGSGTRGLNGLPWAEDLIKVAQTITTVVNNSMADEAEELKKDFADLSKRYDDFYKDLGKASTLLGETDNNLKTSNLTAIIGHETPDDFYNRTIHQGNIGILSIEAVGKYIDNKLKLNKEFSLAFN